MFHDSYIYDLSELNMIEQVIAIRKLMNRYRKLRALRLLFIYLTFRSIWNVNPEKVLPTLDAAQTSTPLVMVGTGLGH
jgi:hypothetical protein